MEKKNSTAPKKAMIFNSVLMINTNNVVSLINSLPKSKMSESSFNDYMENNFYFGGKFHGNDFNSGSHYSTVVRQLGLYHIYENEYIPRFYADVDAQTVELFLKYWLKLYIAPNPTSQSSFRKSVVQPKFVLKEIIQFIENNQSITNIYEIIENLYGVEFSRNDKNQLPSVINSYSDCIDVDKNGNVTLRPNYKQVMNEINELIDNPNRYFEHFGKGEQTQSKIDCSLQKIYYGAPGTGKSHTIDGIVTEENSIRTTFHPDSDYASFVGCYKPVAKIVDSEKKEITYDFVPQAFTRAYIEAWKDTSKPYYLVIEEINRGNCAQIFGDIFQLLDRGEDGFSSYKITPDTDLHQYLAEEFAEVDIADADIKEGLKMQLPNNLHILATMNTSDQSLFPIDSAFKRRWEWKYIPIKNEGKNHKIVVDGAKYDWFAFMKLVNDRIENVTDSEDKQIGYWFAKANEKDEISAETLVSKVIFYLWNDVFKDYAHSDNSLFNIKNRKYKFREFYHENGDVNTILLKQFLKELGLKDETSQTEEVPSAEENQEPEQPVEA